MPFGLLVIALASGVILLCAVEACPDPLEGGQHLLGIVGGRDRLSGLIEADDPFVDEFRDVGVEQRDVDLIAPGVGHGAFGHVLLLGGDLGRKVEKRSLGVLEEGITEVPPARMAEGLVTWSTSRWSGESVQSTPESGVDAGSVSSDRDSSVMKYHVRGQ